MVAEVAPTDGISEQEMAEIRTALKELGLSGLLKMAGDPRQPK